MQHFLNFILHKCFMFMWIKIRVDVVTKDVILITEVNMLLKIKGF